MFGLGWLEITALIVIALLVFGPEKLPQAAAQAGRTLRNLRRMANNARDDLRAGLGPEFADFDPTDLNPKNFVRKHLLDDVEDSWNGNPATATDPLPEPALGAAESQLGYGEIPPYDSEAT
ncbi:sec-independent translocase [Nonomuraea sp. NPDC050663]|uniref:sec-independent translocase n=1 Tax=Nonomuraea sp. NPDC050663 TaxID=3364370 RepID=UPI003794726F